MHFIRNSTKIMRESYRYYCFDSIENHQIVLDQDPMIEWAIEWASTKYKPLPIWGSWEEWIEEISNYSASIPGSSLKNSKFVPAQRGRNPNMGAWCLHMFAPLDIAYAVGMLDRYQDNPNMEHWRVKKKIIQFLQIEQKTACWN